MKKVIFFQNLNHLATPYSNQYVKGQIEVQKATQNVTPGRTMVSAVSVAILKIT